MTRHSQFHIIAFTIIAAKADEAARKKREKDELLRQEEAELGAPKVKKVPALSKKSKKKKDDLSLLEDALVKNAEKSTRARKQAQEEKQQAELRKQQEKYQQQAAPVDPLLQNTNDMLNVEAGRSINKSIMEEGATSGIDAGLASLNVGGVSSEPQKSQKQLYKEFEERMLPLLKEDYPGLRLSQYQEKIFALWKKSPENPMNQVPTSS
jgi:hypothetical protein